MSSYFPNLILYRIVSKEPLTQERVEEALSKTPFHKCLATQEKSAGWLPARGEDNGALCESVGGHWIARYGVETKSVPAAVLNAHVQEKCDAIEKEFGRQPGKKEERELKDEAKLDLLPKAFPKQSQTFIWIDPQAKLLAVGTSTQGRADDIVSLLVESIKGFGVALIDTQSSAQSCMAHWLFTQEPPAGWSIDRSAVLKAADESKAVVRYTNHPLDIAEVKQHIEHGKLPISLAMSWDDRVSLVLTESMTIKGLQFLDAALDSYGDSKGFDTDMAIFTGELSKLIPDLLQALGGEGLSEIQPSEDASATDAANGMRKAVTKFKTNLQRGLRPGESVSINGVVVAKGPELTDGTGNQ